MQERSDQGRSHEGEENNLSRGHKRKIYRHWNNLPEHVRTLLGDSHTSEVEGIFYEVWEFSNGSEKYFRRGPGKVLQCIGGICNPF
jgi:hypothetical protein